MNAVLPLLVAFVTIGLASTRLGKLTYPALGLAVLVYAALAYVLYA